MDTLYSLTDRFWRTAPLRPACWSHGNGGTVAARRTMVPSNYQSWRLSSTSPHNISIRALHLFHTCNKTWQDADLHRPGALNKRSDIFPWGLTDLPGDSGYLDMWTLRRREGAFWQLFQQTTIKCGYTRRLWSNSNGQQVGTSGSSHRLGPFLQANTWHSSASCARQNGPWKSCPPCSAAQCCVIALQQEVGSQWTPNDPTR